MKKLLCLLSVLSLSFAAFAQENVIPQRLELVEIEEDEGDVSLEVFQFIKDGQSSYFLSVGNLGIGNEIVQINVDPVFELFIPLGETLSEAMEVLQQMQELFKTGAGSSLEVTGCLAPAFPTDEREPVKVTSRRLLLSRVLEFSVDRGDYIRATHVPRSSFNSLVTSLKLYRKIHPAEE